MVLRTEDVAHLGVKGSETNTSNGVVGHAVLLHQLVDVDSQMGPVEATNTDVDDALLDGATASIVGGLDAALAGGQDLGEVLCVELEGRHCGGGV